MTVQKATYFFTFSAYFDILKRMRQLWEFISCLLYLIAEGVIHAVLFRDQGVILRLWVIFEVVRVEIEVLNLLIQLRVTWLSLISKDRRFLYHINLFLTSLSPHLTFHLQLLLQRPNLVIAVTGDDGFVSLDYVMRVFRGASFWLGW